MENKDFNASDIEFKLPEKDEKELQFKKFQETTGRLRELGYSYREIADYINANLSINLKGTTLASYIRWQLSVSLERLLILNDLLLKLEEFYNEKIK